MAKSTRSMTFEKAVIDMEAGTITEYLKDDTNVYKIRDILEKWDGVDGITLSIKQIDLVRPTDDKPNEQSDEYADEENEV